MNMKDLNTLPMPLAADELTQLAGYEQTIKDGLTTFYAVGTALVEIRNRKLYRGDHRTFEAYCKERWNISRGHAYRMIDAAEVVNDLSPMGDILPNTERQARALKPVPSEQRADVWQKAVDANDGAPPTAKQVKDVIRKEVVLSVKPERQEPEKHREDRDCPECGGVKTVAFTSWKSGIYTEYGIRCRDCGESWNNAHHFDTAHANAERERLTVVHQKHGLLPEQPTCASCQTPIAGNLETHNGQPYHAMCHYRLTHPDEWNTEPEPLSEETCDFCGRTYPDTHLFIDEAPGGTMGVICRSCTYKAILAIADVRAHSVPPLSPDDEHTLRTRLAEYSKDVLIQEIIAYRIDQDGLRARIASQSRAV